MFDISPLIAYFTPVARQWTYANGVWVQLCRSNGDRPILYLYNPGPNALRITTPAGLSAGVDYGLIASGSTLRYTWSEDGPMSTYEWWGVGQGVQQGGNVGVVEVLWQPR
jgi:hypothetical protein